jgi:sugar-specific transcriptional regulator TrmB
VYSTLEALEAQGTIQLVAENPRRYVPLPPESVADRIRSNLEATANRLLSRLKSWERPARVDYMWYIEGKDELRARIGAMIRSATRHVGIRAQDSVLKSFEGDLRHVAEKGARVVMVIYGALNLGFGHVFAHSLRGMTPIGDVENTIVLAVDHEHALVASLVENQGAETHNKAFVSVVNTVIRHDVYLSEIFRHLGPVMDKTFGPALLDLRRILLPAPVIAELKSKLVKSGRLDVGRSRGRAPSK